MKKSSTLARSTGVVSIVTLGSRVLGMVRDMVIAGFFGAGFITDAFFLAFTIPNLLRRLVAEGSLSTAFVPVFTDSLEQSEDSAKRAIREVTSFSVLLTGVLTIIGILIASQLTDFFAPGFSTSEEQRNLTIELTKIMMPYVIIVSLIALGAGALNTLGLFALPAAAPAVLNVAMISSVLIFGQFFDEPIYALAISVPIGGLAALIAQLTLLRRKGYSMGFANPLKSAPVRKIAWLMLPSILASSVYQIMVLVNRMLASMLGQGSISWYYFADRLVQFPLGVFSIALATAILPELSKKASKKDDSGFNAQLLSGLNWVSFIILPATCGLIFLATPLVESIYAYGRFSGNDIPSTANALVAFSVGLWAVSAHAVVVRGFLAKKNTFIPATVSSITIIINIFLAIAFMGKPATQSGNSLAIAITSLQSQIELLSLGHIGLALAGSLAAFINFISLSFCLPRIGCSIKWSSFFISSLRSTFSTCVMAVPLFIVTILPLPSLAQLALGVPAGAAVYFLSARLIGSKELEQTLRMFKK